MEKNMQHYMENMETTAHIYIYTYIDSVIYGILSLLSFITLAFVSTITFCTGL